MNSDKILIRFKDDSEALHYINPRNPNEAVLLKGISKARRSQHLALLLGSILIALIWLAFVSFKL
jgi:hypothetical protein